MRVLIWLGCILVYSIIVTALRGAGIILGGIPTALLALVIVFLPAPALCKLWSRHKEKRVAVPPEKWYTCQRCGQLVREGDECDCSEAEERQKAEELGMTIERYRAFREDIESNVAEKHFRDATKKVEPCESEGRATPDGRRSTAKKALVCIALSILALVSCALVGAVVYLETEIDVLKTENAKLTSTIDRMAVEKRQLQSEVDALERQNETLAESMTEYFNDAMFLGSKIGFIVNGSECYHNYDCLFLKYSDEYWAHNVEYCEYIGYSKCKICW